MPYKNKTKQLQAMREINCKRRGKLQVISLVTKLNEITNSLLAEGELPIEFRPFLIPLKEWSALKQLKEFKEVKTE